MDTLLKWILPRIPQIEPALIFSTKESIIRYFRPQMFSVRAVDSIKHRKFVQVKSVLIIDWMYWLLFLRYIRKQLVSSDGLNQRLKSESRYLIPLITCYISDEIAPHITVALSHVSAASSITSIIRVCATAFISFTMKIYIMTPGSMHSILHYRNIASLF
jgi:hypothetical protein